MRAQQYLILSSVLVCSNALVPSTITAFGRRSKLASSQRRTSEEQNWGTSLRLYHEFGDDFASGAELLPLSDSDMERIATLRKRYVTIMFGNLVSLFLLQISK